MKLKKKELLSFAEWLRQIPDDNFDLSHLANDTLMAEALKESEDMFNCGTVGCAMGWLPTYDAEMNKKPTVTWQAGAVNALLCYKGRETCYDYLAEHYFNIPSDHANHLFDTWGGPWETAEQFIENAYTWEETEEVNENLVLVNGFPCCGPGATPEDVAEAIVLYVDRYPEFEGQCIEDILGEDY